MAAEAKRCDPDFDARPPRRLYDVGAEIGHGGYGSVYDVAPVAGTTTTPLVMKEMAANFVPSRQRMFNHEVLALRMLTEAAHPDVPGADGDAPRPASGPPATRGGAGDADRAGASGTLSGLSAVSESGTSLVGGPRAASDMSGPSIDASVTSSTVISADSVAHDLATTRGGGSAGADAGAARGRAALSPTARTTPAAGTATTRTTSGAPAASAAARRRFVMLRHAYRDEDTDQYELVMDKVNGGELFERLTASGRYSEADAASVFHELMESVQHMHSLGIVHRDLKPENLLLRSADPNSEIVICDFGLCHIDGYVDPEADDTGHVSRAVGTHSYMAPEIWRNPPSYSTASDVWALGCTLFVMLHACLPFDPRAEHASPNQRRAMIRDMVLANDWGFYPDYIPISKSAQDLIERCLDPNPATRITVPEILAHPWFRTAPTVKSADMAKRLRAFLTRSRFRRAVRRLQHAQFLQLRGSHRARTFGAERGQQLGPEVVADMRGAFFRATGGSMFASEAVFGRVLREMMPADAAGEVSDTLFRLFDTDKDGRVDFSEFLAGVAVLWGDSSNDTVRWLFEAFSDAEGGVTEEGFAKIVYALNPEAFASGDAGDGGAGAGGGAEPEKGMACALRALHLFEMYQDAAGVLSKAAFMTGMREHPELVEGLVTKRAKSGFGAALVQRASIALAGAGESPGARSAHRAPGGLRRHDATAAGTAGTASPPPATPVPSRASAGAGAGAGARAAGGDAAGCAHAACEHSRGSAGTGDETTARGGGGSGWWLVGAAVVVAVVAGGAVAFARGTRARRR